MRYFDVMVLSHAVECYEVDGLSRVDYMAVAMGRETLVYRCTLSHRLGKVRNGRDRAASYCHYHAKNIHPDYKFVVREDTDDH